MNGIHRNRVHVKLSKDHTYEHLCGNVLTYLAWDLKIHRCSISFQFYKYLLPSLSSHCSLISENSCLIPPPPIYFFLPPLAPRQSLL